MKSIYRNKKYIARIALISLVFIFLLALSFKIFSGNSNKADIKKLRVNNLKVVEYCIPSDSSKQNVNSIDQNKQLFDIGFTGIIIGSAILLLTYFIRINRGKLFCKRRYTLVSLCVRMDE